MNHTRHSQACVAPVRSRRRLFVCCALIPALLVALQALSPRMAQAHMYNNDHIGYYPGTTSRMFLWYDETGLSDWRAAEYQFAVDYGGYWTYWVGQGIALPYMDYHDSGGIGGCYNDLYAVDVCAGDAGAGHAALAQWTTDGTDYQHMLVATITVRNPSRLSFTQKRQAICQEIGHIMGLDHNETGDTTSCEYPTIQPDSKNAVFYRIHDDVTLRDFYGGHQP